jgi:WD40 repeat protein
MGRVQGAVAQQAEEMYQKLVPLEQQAAARVFLELVQTGENTEDNRRRVGFQEMGEEARGLVKKLADARLVVTGRDEASGQEKVEVAHEALIQSWNRLQEWLNADREFLFWRQRLRADLEEWQFSCQDEGALLRGASLVEAERWLPGRAEDLTPAEREFIQAGLDLRERERLNRQRQQRRRMLALASGLVAALVLLFFAGWQCWREEGRRCISLARQLAAQASLTFSKLGQYLNRSLLLAVESLQRWPTAEALQILSRGLALLPVRVTQTPVKVSGIVKWSVLSPGDRYLACFCDDRTIQVVEVESGRQVTKLTSPKRMDSLVFSPDDRWLAMGLKKMVMVWEAGTGREAARLAAEGLLGTMAWDHSGPRLLTVWHEPHPNTTAVRVLDVISNREVARPLYPKPDPGFWGSTVRFMALTPDGKWLASRGWDNTVRLWDTATGREVARLAHTRGVDYLAFSPDGILLATGMGGSWQEERKATMVSLWEVPGGKETARLPQPAILTCLAFNPNGAWLAAGGGDGVIRVWETSTGSELFPLKPKKLKYDDDNVRSLAFSPDEHRLAAGYTRNGTRVWDLVTRQQLNDEDLGYITAVGFSPDGQWVVSGGQYPEVREAASGKKVVDPHHDGGVKTIAFSPIKPWLASGSEDYCARIWELPSGRDLTRVRHGGAVTRVAFNPDGRFVASAKGCPGEQWKDPSCQALVRVWEAATGVEVGQFPHEKGIDDVAFSPDGRLLASACRDGTARLWH